MGVTALVYHYGDTGSVSNTIIQALSSTGTIVIEADTSIDVKIDVQGYYTAGDPDAGGYMSVTPTRLVNTADGTGLSGAGVLASGSDTVVQASGLASIPSSASAVFVNFQVSSSSVTGYLKAYDTGGTVPDTTLNYMPSVTTSIGATVPLSSSGQFTLHVGGSSSVNLTVDVLGYFTAATNTGSFTPAATRVIDSNVSPNVAIPAGGTLTVPVAGINGIPAAGSGIASVAVNVHIRHSGTASGYAVIWPADQTEPGTNSFTYAPGATMSNLFTVALSAAGAIKIHNVSTDAIGYAVDVEGWYTSVTGAVPSGQTQTQQSITLQGSPLGGGAWITYSYRVGTTASFIQVPVGDVQDGAGHSPTAWPVTTSGGTFTAYVWNIRQSLINATGSAPDGLIQVKACYGVSSTDPNPACAMPTDIQFAQSAFGDAFATDQVGPGTLALLTGDYTIAASDAAAASSLGGLGLGRSLTTLAPADAGLAPGSQRIDASGVFGPAWTADLAGPGAGEADLRLTDDASTGYLVFTGPDGSSSSYEATTPVGTYPISFAGVNTSADKGLTVTKVSSTSVTMADAGGTVTTWTKASSIWQATSVAEPGSNSSSTYNYNGSGLVTRILGPVPSGVSCSSAPDTTPGCRSLTLTYQTITVSGVNLTRLQKVNVSLPQTSGTSNITVVAQYDYNATAQLIDAYDPRISPNLKTAYTYNPAGRLATLTPPGQAAYTLGYDSTGRLSTISRPDPSGSTAITTIVYGLAISGASAPVPLDAATAGTWDQTSDLPVTGTAVFQPDHQPAGPIVASGDWPYATLHYLDVNGEEVNTATYGAGAWQIDTTQYDANGKDVWELSAGNRAQALSPTSATDSYVAGLSSNVARAALLASSTVVNPLDPSQVTDTFGPTHPVTLNNGANIHAQDHHTTVYDQGAPNADIDPHTDAAYGLATTVVSDPFDVVASTDSGYPDAATTTYGYAAVNTGDTTGWSLYRPTTTTVQMGSGPSSSDLVTATRYDTSGRVIETRLPANPSGGTAQSTVTSYFTATGSGSCVSAKWAGLLCSTMPAAQPSTGSPLATTTYTYNQFGEPLTKTETYGSSGTIRTTTNTFDGAGRSATQNITVTPSSAGGTVLPTVTYGYSTTLGLPTTAGTSSNTVTTGYNNIGEPTSYTDAASTTSTMGYDIDGHLTTVNDGKGTTTYTYDSSSEHRGLVTSEDIGVAGALSTFSASYDASGNPAVETYPNGLTATYSFDNTDNATQLVYAKSGTTWMTFTQTIGDNDHVVAQSSPQSSQNFAYDHDGRLTTVQDTYASSCATRVYAFDANSNRTSLKSYPAATGGACSTTTTPVTTASSYDQADRKTNTGYAYDTLGRTTTVASADAKGIAGYSGLSGNLNVGYDTNDMVSTETQGSTTLTFTLDPLQNRINTSSDGSTTITNHYAGDTDSPAWTSTSAVNWTRNLTGINGTLAATSDNTNTVTLQLNNLHGDIVATAADTTGATGPISYGESTEYGLPRTASTAFATYGWLGSTQRSANALGGLMVMGVRLYNPATGRFLSADPVVGGNANAYIYPADPVGNYDTSGKFNFWRYMQSYSWSYTSHYFLGLFMWAHVYIKLVFTHYGTDLMGGPVGLVGWAASAAAAVAAFFIAPEASAIAGLVFAAGLEIIAAAGMAAWYDRVLTIYIHFGRARGTPWTGAAVGTW